MKTSKAASLNPSQEECGVWLDTVQLKGKAKQKRLAPPISKLLNPFTKGEGYNLAVALNFTQTKMEMPKTKQSSISKFFTPHQRVLHKMSSSEMLNPDPVQPLSSFTVLTAVASGKKRERDICPEKSDLNDIDPGVDCERKRENISEIKAASSQNHRRHHSPSLNHESEEKRSEECEPPHNKKRHTEPSLLIADSHVPPQAWSQDPLFTCSQDSDSEFYQTCKKYTQKNRGNSEPCFLDILQSEEVFGNRIDLKGRTSTQTPDKKHSQKEDEKENSRPDFLSSPSRHFSLSQLTSLPSHKWAETKNTPPLKHADHQWNKAGKEVRFKSARTQPSSSPLKQNSDVDEDSLATLFTQDSEGFRVIAHRSLQTRSPLKDHSNLSTRTVRNCASKSVEDDEEDEMLFTQDSQGNVVIKH